MTRVYTRVYVNIARVCVTYTHIYIYAYEYMSIHASYLIFDVTYTQIICVYVHMSIHASHVLIYMCI